MVRMRASDSECRSAAVERSCEGVLVWPEVGKVEDVGEAMLGRGGRGMAGGGEGEGMETTDWDFRTEFSSLGVGLLRRLWGIVSF
jgi:hypothetical protein